MTSEPARPSGASPFSIDLPADLPVEYANVVRIAHSPAELVFDFAHVLPGVFPGRVQSRIVMSPLAAKLFSRALIENLGRFEKSFGEIIIPGGTSLAEQLFRPPAPPDDPDHR